MIYTERSLMCDGCSVELGYSAPLAADVRRHAKRFGWSYYYKDMNKVPHLTMDLCPKCHDDHERAVRQSLSSVGDR